MTDMNVYYSPQNLGMTLIGSLSDDSLSYEFDIYIVVQDNKTGRVLAENDAGCSCPTPFEGISLADMREIQTLDAFRSDVKQWNERYDHRRASKQEIDALEEKVRTALRRRAALKRYNHA